MRSRCTPFYLRVESVTVCMRSYGGWQAVCLYTLSPTDTHLGRRPRLSLTGRHCSSRRASRDAVVYSSPVSAVRHADGEQRCREPARSKESLSIRQEAYDCSRRSRRCAQASGSPETKCSCNSVSHVTPQLGVLAVLDQESLAEGTRYIGLCMWQPLTSAVSLSYDRMKLMF